MSAPRPLATTPVDSGAVGGGRRTDWLLGLVPVALAALLWAPGVAGGSIVNGDDAFYAIVLRDLAEGRADLVTALGWRMPAFYLLGWVSVVALGASELALRLPSLLCGLACVGLTYQLGRALWPRRRGVALWAALLLAASGQMFIFARRVRGLDLLLTALALGALLLVARGGPGRWRWPVVGLLLGLGFLTKSVVIFTFGLPFLVLWLGTARGGRERLLTALAVLLGFVAVAGAWLGYVALAGDSAGLASHFRTHVAARAASGALVGEAAGPTYFLRVLWDLEGWPGFLGLAFLLVLLGQGLRGERASLAVALGGLSMLIAFSLASTKLPHYLLPAYPALALALAGGIDYLVDSARSAELCSEAGAGWLVHAVGGAVVAVAVLASPIGILESWGRADWSPHLKAGALAARELLPAEGQLLVLNEYHAAALYYFDGPTRLLTTDPGFQREYARVPGFIEGRHFSLVSPAEVGRTLVDARPACLLVRDELSWEGLSAELSEVAERHEVSGARVYCVR